LPRLGQKRSEPDRRGASTERPTGVPARAFVRARDGFQKGRETMNGLESIEMTRTAIQGIPGLWAYLDPGTGSMVLQVLLAGLLSSTFFVKTWVRHIRYALPLKPRKS
jgi:hypothetical protein